MASAQPVIRQVAWISALPQLAIGLLLVLAAYLVGMDHPILVGAAAYLVVSVAVRRLVAAHHRKGIAFFKKEDFAQAADAFERSYQFFSRHAWIDKYRYITLMSSSAIGYREMALVNIAFCHSQMGNGKLAKEYYEKALTEFPDSRIAKSSLRMLASAQELFGPGRSHT